jgi:cobalt/nickel transport system permease protein
MHIPDGFLTTPVIFTTYLGSSTTLVFIWKKILEQFNQQSIPKVAILAAFIFITQMINIPIAGGTSGHLIGGFLATLLVGPYTAIFIISLVLTVQMLIFQDGGLTALGANIFNMGIAGIYLSYFVYMFSLKFLKKYLDNLVVHLTLIFICSWLYVEIGAILCGIELSISGLADWKITVSFLFGIHALIGILEGIMTILIFKALQQIRPDLVYLSNLKQD